MPNNNNGKQSRCAGLVQIRNTRGMAAKIARQLGVTKQAIAKWHKVDKVPKRRIAKVARITGIDPELLSR